MLWIFTILLFVFGLFSLIEQPALGAGIFVLCIVIYDKKLKGTPFRLFPRRQRVAKQYRQSKPPKLSRRERRKLDREEQQAQQLQDQQAEIRRLQAQLQTIQQQNQQYQDRVNHSARTRFYDEIQGEQLEEQKRMKTQTTNTRLENEIRDLKRQIRNSKYD